MLTSRALVAGSTASRLVPGCRSSSTPAAPSTRRPGSRGSYAPPAAATSQPAAVSRSKASAARTPVRPVAPKVTQSRVDPWVSRRTRPLAWAVQSIGAYEAAVPGDHDRGQDRDASPRDLAGAPLQLSAPAPGSQALEIEIERPRAVGEGREAGGPARDALDVCFGNRRRRRVKGEPPQRDDQAVREGRRAHALAYTPTADRTDASGPRINRAGHLRDPRRSPPAKARRG